MLLFTAFVGSAAKADDFVYGADLSLLKFIEDHGVQYRDGGKPQDAIAIFKNHGCNFVRLRLFLDPNGKDGQVNSLPYTIELAKRVKAAGLRFLLDLHYSDGWADPGHQVIPAAWKDLTHAQLVDQVFTYTRDTLAAFQQAGCAPDMAEVGNEVTNGVMWPDGGPLTDAKWNDFTDLIRAGIRGVHANDDSIKIMIHIDKGSDQKVSKWFFDHLTQQGVHFDVIGLSYYPFGGGSLADLKANLDYLARTYGKDVMVAETSYNWQFGDASKSAFGISPAAQKAFLTALIHDVASVPDGRGKGVFYWAPEWIESDKWQVRDHAWDNRAFFDEKGNALPVLDAFQATPQ